MLSERLLTKNDYECDRELRTLELLKVRFGEGNLLNAEIMLKVSKAVLASCISWRSSCLLSSHFQTRPTCPQCVGPGRQQAHQ